MVFFRALFYQFTYPNSDECEAIDDHSSCEAAPSKYANNQSKCYWDIESAACRYIQPDGDIEVMLYVTIFSALLALLIGTVVSYLLETILAAKIKCDEIEQKEEDEEDSSMFLESNSAADVLNRYPSKSGLKKTLFQKHLEHKNYTESMKWHALTTVKLSALSTALQHHRMTFSDSERADFDSKFRFEVLILQYSSRCFSSLYLISLDFSCMGTR